MKGENMTSIDVSTIETGCYVDGHWGQYGAARVIEIARGLGYANDVLTDIADRHLFQCGHPGSDVDISDDEHETMSEAADEVEAWLNAHAAADGYSWGWYDGEFFYQSAEWWEES